MTLTELKKEIKKGVLKHEESKQNQMLRSLAISRKSFELFVNNGKTEGNKLKAISFPKIVELSDLAGLEVIIQPKKINTCQDKQYH